MIVAVAFLACGTDVEVSPPGLDCAYGLGLNEKPFFGVASMVCEKDIDSGFACCEAYTDECGCSEYWCENLTKGCWIRMDDISTCAPDTCLPQNSSITE
jgi:hypothetical protein